MFNHENYTGVGFRSWPSDIPKITMNGEKVLNQGHDYDFLEVKEICIFLFLFFKIIMNNLMIIIFLDRLFHLKGRLVLVDV